jgi:hypothetical protein
MFQPPQAMKYINNFGNDPMELEESRNFSPFMGPEGS